MAYGLEGNSNVLMKNRTFRSISSSRWAISRKWACIVAVSWRSDTISQKTDKNLGLCVDYTCGRKTTQPATGHLPAKTLDCSYPYKAMHGKQHVYNTHNSKLLPFSAAPAGYPPTTTPTSEKNQPISYRIGSIVYLVDSLSLSVLHLSLALAKKLSIMVLSRWNSYYILRSEITQCWILKSSSHSIVASLS